MPSPLIQTTSNARPASARRRASLTAGESHFAAMYGIALYFSKAEAKRVAVNRWIRDSAAGHRVIDFEAVVRDPADPGALEARFDFGDHLHCNDAGLAAMANAVDLESWRRSTG